MLNWSHAPNYSLYASVLFMLHVHEPTIAASMITHLVGNPKT